MRGSVFFVRGAGVGATRGVVWGVWRATLGGAGWRWVAWGAARGVCRCLPVTSIGAYQQ